jgi:dinuclear metal center YbgI/SA1388 family protein
VSTPIPANPTLAQVAAILDGFYPPSLAEPWDAVGLVTGDPGDGIGRVRFAVDPVHDAVTRALDWGADLLVVHHPLLLRPVHSVAATTFKGAIVHRLIRAGCALYTAHTNADAAVGGVADALGEAIGLQDMEPVVPARTPDGAARPARADSPASALGSGDIARQAPADAARPGRADSPASALGPGDIARQIPADAAGLGRAGHLASSMSLGEFAQRVAGVLPATHHGVRVAGDLEAPVMRIAVVAGAGDSLFEQVRAADVDVYVTADLRHHPASEARERAEFDAGGRPYLVDVSHSASEWHWLARAARRLTECVSDLGARVETAVDPVVADPWAARFASPNVM